MENFDNIDMSQRPKNSKYKALLHILAKLLCLAIYVVDLGTDINASIMHFLNGDFYWGLLTIMFTIKPMIISSFLLIINEIPTFDTSRPVKCLLALTATLCSPIVPFSILLYDAVSSIQRYPSSYDDYANRLAWFVKLSEATGEAYPQAALQMHIVVMSLGADKAVGFWQYLTIGTSLIALAFPMVTNLLFHKADGCSKSILFIFGLVSSTSRIMVYSIYSMKISVLWYVPFGTQLAVAVIVWSIKRLCPCSTCVPLAKVPHRSARKVAMVKVVLTWFMTVSFNCFSLSGLYISIINLVFAVGGFILDDVPQYIAITAFTLAAFSCFANNMFAIAPGFKKIGKLWLVQANDDDLSPSILY